MKRHSGARTAGRLSAQREQATGRKSFRVRLLVYSVGRANTDESKRTKVDIKSIKKFSSFL